MYKRNEQQISKLKRKFTLPVLYSVDQKFRFDEKENCQNIYEISKVK